MRPPGSSLRAVNPEWLMIVALILLLLSVPVWVVVSATMESKTYNKLTGAATTWWDALWVELRVQDAPQRSTP